MIRAGGQPSKKTRIRPVSPLESQETRCRVLNDGVFETVAQSVSSFRSGGKGFSLLAYRVPAHSYGSMVWLRLPQSSTRWTSFTEPGESDTKFVCRIQAARARHRDHFGMGCYLIIYAVDGATKTLMLGPRECDISYRLSFTRLRGLLPENV